MQVLDLFAPRWSDWGDSCLLEAALKKVALLQPALQYLGEKRVRACSRTLWVAQGRLDVCKTVHAEFGINALCDENWMRWGRLCVARIFFLHLVSAIAHHGERGHVEEAGETLQFAANTLS